MPCPLIGRIALIADPNLDTVLEPGVHAVRVRYRGHDTILIGPDSPVYARMEQALDLIDADEQERLVFGVDCTCTRAALSVCA